MTARTLPALLGPASQKQPFFLIPCCEPPTCTVILHANFPIVNPIYRSGSAISGFKIALKSAKGKLRLQEPLGEWFERIVEHHELAVLAHEANICLAAAELAPIHEDPCDRFIIATVIANGFTVVTADERFRPYGVPVIC